MFGKNKNKENLNEETESIEKGTEKFIKVNKVLHPLSIILNIIVLIIGFVNGDVLMVFVSTSSAMFMIFSKMLIDESSRHRKEKLNLMVTNVKLKVENEKLKLFQAYNMSVHKNDDCKGR